MHPGQQRHHARRWPPLSFGFTTEARRQGAGKNTETRECRQAGVACRHSLAGLTGEEAERTAILLSLQIHTRENGGLVRPCRTGRRCRASVSFFLGSPEPLGEGGSAPLCLRGSVVLKIGGLCRRDGASRRLLTGGLPFCFLPPSFC